MLYKTRGLIHRYISWWPISFLLPPAAMMLFQQSRIVINGYSYSVENLGHMIWFSSLIGPRIILSVMITELLIVGWQESSLRQLLFIRTPSCWSDIGVAIMMTLRLDRVVAAVLSFGLTVISFSWMHDKLADATGFRYGLDSLSVFPQYMIGFTLYTFFDYWDHRLVHMKVFWPLHRFHHAANEFYVITAGRVHPADISTVFIMTGPLVLLGISPNVLVAVLLTRVYIGQVIHSKISEDFGWIGRWIFYSPVGHRMHHALFDSSQEACNFGLIPIWDQLFGTYKSGGISENSNRS